MRRGKPVSDTRETQDDRGVGEVGPRVGETEGGSTSRWVGECGDSEREGEKLGEWGRLCVCGVCKRVGDRDGPIKDEWYPKPPGKGLRRGRVPEQYLETVLVDTERIR